MKEALTTAERLALFGAVHRWDEVDTESLGSAIAKLEIGDPGKPADQVDPETQAQTSPPAKPAPDCECPSELVPGARFPAAANGDHSRAWVERCDACQRFDGDLSAALALSAEIGLKVAVACPAGSGTRTPYLVGLRFEGAEDIAASKRREPPLRGAADCNARGVERGWRAVEYATDRNYADDGTEGLGRDLSDLMANAMHLASHSGLDVEDVLERARTHWEAEMNDARLEALADQKAGDGRTRVYRVEASANIDADGEDSLQSKLAGIARVLSDGDGDLGYDWDLTAEPVEADTLEHAP